MSSRSLLEPPTQLSLAEARAQATDQRARLVTLTAQLHAAEDELERVITESRSAIRVLEKERAAAEDNLAHTLAYLSPIRRLPNEILGQIFMHVFEELPCCPWVLSAVSSHWRRRVLAMPKLWSKIRIVTTQNSSADTIRLWLERSGRTVPLDIEIFLRTSTSTNDTASTRGGRSGSTALHGPATWGPPTPYPMDDYDGGPDPGTPELTPADLPPYPFIANALPGPAGLNGGLLPAASRNQQDAARASSQAGKSRGSIHWGHIAFYYLVEQMHRWERFVFRFDRRFASVDALKSIIGDAPRLREFEISCAEPAFFTSNDWSGWLPSAKSNLQVDLSSLEILTLQHVPFKWSSPLFSNLRVLSLRSLHNNPHALDRILYIIGSNPNLESLTLHCASVSTAILPLSSISLDNMRSLTISGHYLLSGVLDCLVVPALESLTLDIESRDSIEDVITHLVERSNSPQIKHLSISYSAGHTGGLYYGPNSIVTSWNFLNVLEHLQTLQVGGCPFDTLIQSLDGPADDDQEQWYCPKLTALCLRACHTHQTDGVSKLVRMVEARNPVSASPSAMFAGEAPQKLQKLELYECAVMGQDVVRWLSGRIESVVCTDPTNDRRLF